MRKLAVSAFLLVVILAATVAPAFAITGDFVKDFEHPFVGLITFQDANGDFLWRCSGSLISPTAVLTAGHCTDTGGGAVSAIVYFQQDAGVHYDPALGYDPVSGYPEYCAAGTQGTTCATASTLIEYGYTGSLTLPQTHDVGLVILDQPISMPEYGQLPTANYLDTLDTKRGKQDLIFTASGYGLTYKNMPQTGKPNISYRERLMATAKLVNLNSTFTNGFNLQTQGNGTGMGGTCNGDSGGPVFYGGYDLQPDRRRDVLRPERALPRHGLRLPHRPARRSGLDLRQRDRLAEVGRLPLSAAQLSKKPGFAQATSRAKPGFFIGSPYLLPDHGQE